MSIPMHFDNYFSAGDFTNSSSDPVGLKELPQRIPLTPVEVTAAALPVPVQKKAAWRLTLIVLILGSCHGKSATIEQLHALLWAITDEKNRNIFLSTWFSRETASAPLRRFSPELEDTLTLGRAERLLEEKTNSRHTLTARGKEYLRLLNSDDHLMSDEKVFLTQIRPITTTRMWNNLGSVRTTIHLAQVRGTQGDT